MLNFMLYVFLSELRKRNNDKICFKIIVEGKKWVSIWMGQNWSLTDGLGTSIGHISVHYIVLFTLVYLGDSL